MYTACHDVPPTMLLLHLIVAAIFGALKWQGTPTQGSLRKRSVALVLQKIASLDLFYVIITTRI
jgi:hypothetical protein